MLRSAIKSPLHVMESMSIRKLHPCFSECNSELSRRFSSFLKEFRSALPKTKMLTIDVPCNLKLKPIDPQLQLDDCIIARAHGLKESEFIMKLLERESSLLFTAQSTQPQAMKKAYLEIEIPVRCDIDVVSKLGDVTVENFVSDHLSVQAQNGDISCKKLNCGSIYLNSSIGGISCEGTLLGNIKLKAGELGSISGANFQGNILEIETDDGDVLVSSTYSDKSFFTSKKGNVSLKNLHRKSCVSIQKGNLTVSGLDGNLDAQVQDGNIKVQVTKLDGDSFLETKNGNVSLSLARDDVCQLDLSARKIVILEENLISKGKINHSENGKVFRSFPISNITQAVMKVVCKNGEIQLKEESWISSLNIGGH